MKKRILSLLLILALLVSIYPFVNSIPAFATAIDVGGNGSSPDNFLYTDTAQTVLDVNNPANASGTLSYFSFFYHGGWALTGIKVGTFYGSGTDWTCRDWESVGDIASGGGFTKKECTVSLTVQADDVIGIVYIGALANVATGGTQLYKYHLDGMVNHYTDYYDNGNIPCMYATGDTGGAPATVTISAGTSITGTTATISGNVTNIGSENPTVTVFWGDNDGLDIPGDWDYNSAPTSPSQPQGAVGFYKNVTSLSKATRYYFSANATNAGGTDWPPASLSFLTLPDPPSGISHTDHDSHIDFSWTNATGGAGTTVYTLARYATSNYPTTPYEGEMAIFPTANTTSCSVSGFTNGTTYYFSFFSRAINGSNIVYSSTYVQVATSPARTVINDTYYVKPTGSDSNDGLGTGNDHAWLTIQHGLDVAGAGDTVEVMAGDYNTTNLMTANNGDADGYLILKNYQNDVVNIHLYETNWNGFRIKHNYIKIIGINFDGLSSGHLDYGNETDGYYSCRYGLYLTGYAPDGFDAHHILVQNCYLSYTYWCTLYCLDAYNIVYDGNTLDHPRQISSAGEECMSICNTSYFEVRDCIVHDGGVQALGIDMKEGSHDGSVHDNEVYNLTGSYNAGIYVSPNVYAGCTEYNIDIFRNKVHDVTDGIGSQGIAVNDECPNDGVNAGSVSDISIYNNIVWDCGRGFAMTQMGGETYGYSTYTRIYFLNNTVYSNADLLYGTEGLYINVGATDATDIVYRNNIAYATQSGATPIYDCAVDRGGELYTGGKLTVDHNLWYDSGGAWTSGSSCVFGTDTVLLDPLFISTAAKDFRLQNGSPAKNAASSTLAPAKDYGGTIRPQDTSYDIGAWEYILISLLIGSGTGMGF